MNGLARDRQRVLGAVWLLGALLTALVLLLPYEVRDDPAGRLAVVALSVGTATVLLLGPTLATWALHVVLAGGTAIIAACGMLGVPEVEAVMFLVPVLFAYATFPARQAAGQLVFGSAAYGLSLVLVDDARQVGPWVSWVLVTGVMVMTATIVAGLRHARERAVAAGERDRRIATALQEALVPAHLPELEGGAVAACYLPAAEEADVGGDFLDVLPLGSGRVLLAVGDVAGKGLGAAACVGHTRLALRALALDDPEPAALLRRLDRVLATEAEPRMTTLAVVLVDPLAGLLTHASAGHPPPLLLPAGEPARALEDGRGTPLAVVGDGAQFSAGKAPLAAGDRVLLYTDGLVERRGESIDVGLERLRAAVSGARRQPDALVEASLDALDRTARRDDVAVLAYGLDEVALPLPPLVELAQSSR